MRLQAKGTVSYSLQRIHGRYYVQNSNPSGRTNLPKAAAAAPLSGYQPRPGRANSGFWKDREEPGIGTKVFPENRIPELSRP